MPENFTLLLLSQHYPDSPQFQFLSYEDVSVDAEVAVFLQTAEQQVNRDVLNKIYAFAKEAVAE